MDPLPLTGHVPHATHTRSAQAPRSVDSCNRVIHDADRHVASQGIRSGPSIRRRGCRASATPCAAAHLDAAAVGLARSGRRPRRRAVGGGGGCVRAIQHPLTAATVRSRPTIDRTRRRRPPAAVQAGAPARAQRSERHGRPPGSGAVSCNQAVWPRCVWRRYIEAGWRHMVTRTAG